ncbi:MAG: bifunctional UDP-N-acetylglucosamine diphosphorylase/glucosamine-1-phosphate N-acetyltransferase GlmU [Elusimicrobiota bacterium]
MPDKAVLILAAGLGTRMKSDIPKVLHTFDNKPLIIRLLEKIEKLKIKNIIIVVGYKAEFVVDVVKKWNANKGFNIVFVYQKLLKGSGQAVVESAKEIKKFEDIFIISGDIPLISLKTLKGMLRNYDNKKIDALILTATVSDTKSYGRIIRDNNKNVKAIVEADELKGDEKLINEINGGVYIFKTKKLLEAIRDLKPKGLKKEYYLTDAIENIYKSGGKIDTFIISDEDEISGPNSKKELNELEKRYYMKNAIKLGEEGVSIKSPEFSYISETVEIARDTIIYPDTHIYGNSKIGKNCSIGPYVIIEDSIIKDNCTIKPFSYISKSVIREGSIVGPFSHIRPESDIGPDAKIGNFSEIKKSKIGKGSKVPHLSYIGDCEMGEKVNIGAGTITCNYDGVKKHKTTINSGAFIGSNTNLVAPVRIGKNALIGAGSTITIDIPDNKLAIARSREVIKEKKRKV